jgi:hypothetical protein
MMSHNFFPGLYAAQILSIFVTVKKSEGGEAVTRIRLSYEWYLR